MLAWSVHLPGTRHHVEQPFVTKLTSEHKRWHIPNGFAFVLFLRRVVTR